VDSRWYTPDEPWPTHDKPWWADALRDARSAGWHLRIFSGHTWGKVVCDRELSDAHQMLIFSTGRGGENAAKQLHKLIGRCHHARNQADDNTFVRAGRLLLSAARLLDAAKLLLEAADTRGRAQELLSLAEQQLAEFEESEGLLDAAITLEGQSSYAEQRAAELTSAAKYSPKRPFTGKAITDEAELRVDEADTGPTAPVIAQRADQLRARIRMIRGRL
jgi:hypothetical protein